MRKASMTVEAALVLPLFVFAMILTGYIAQMAVCQDEVQWALTRIAREASAEYGVTRHKAAVSRSVYQLKLAKYLDGSAGRVSLFNSDFDEEKDEILLVAEYRLNLPFRFIPDRMCRFRCSVHTRAFTGVDDRGREEEQQHSKKVYITETGRVYHEALQCTYLKLSISQLKGEDVERLRNESGGRYKPCEKCCRDTVCRPDQTVWITNFGDRYHINRGCSGLKRRIRTIWLEEAGTRTPCSKCAKGDDK